MRPPETDDDDSYIVSTLEEGGLALRPLLRIISLIALPIALVAVVLLFAAYRNAPVITRPPIFTDTPVDQNGLPLLPDGWQVAGPAGDSAIVIAPSTPQIAYACGYSARLGIHVERSSDGGRTWSAPVSVLGNGPDCALSVDPTDPQDVIVNDASQATNDGQIASNLFRSFDGGQNWQIQTLPDVKVNTPFSRLFNWAGSTLYVALNWSKTLPHVLAASVDGGAFAYADPPVTALGGDPQAPQLFHLIGVGQTVYVDFRLASATTPQPDGGPALVTLLSADAGHTWMPTHLAYKNQSVRLVNGTVDGHGLLARSADADTLLLSDDGGATWHATPTLAAHGLRTLGDNVTATPDGTIYAEVIAQNGPGDTIQAGQTGVMIFTAPPQTGWQHVVLMTTQGPGSQWAINPFTAIWDANGHATALWGTATDTSDDPAQNGLTELAMHTIHP